MEKSPVLRETLFLLVSELIVNALTAAVYFLLDLSHVIPDVFSYRVITGGLLGTAVVVINFFFLAAATDRAFSKALEERGNGEMTDEEAAEFAAKNKASVQAAMTASQLFRTLFMIGVLILAFVLPWFDGIAALIPLVMFRPILLIREFFRKEK